MKEISRLEISEVPVNRQDYISYNSSNLFTAIDKGRNTKCQGAVTVPVHGHTETKTLLALNAHNSTVHFREPADLPM